MQSMHAREVCVVVLVGDNCYLHPSTLLICPSFIYFFKNILFQNLKNLTHFEKHFPKI